MTTINNTASLLMNSYKNGIQAAICEKARTQSEREKEDGNFIRISKKYEPLKHPNDRL